MVSADFTHPNFGDHKFCPSRIRCKKFKNVKIQQVKLIRGINFAGNLTGPLVLTIGNFDGVHQGHMRIIDEVKKIAAIKKISSAILTFEPHPSSFFKKSKSEDFRLTSLAQKLQIFREAGLDYVIILPFNHTLSQFVAVDFVEKILIEKLRVKHLVIGHDFIFGKGGQGDFELLLHHSKKLNFALDRISAIRDEDEIYSSSRVRQLISSGNMTLASKILGRNFAVSGLVVEGKKLARQLGFPTMNMVAKKQIIKPKFGVYKSLVFIPSLNKKLPAITNFGIKPTVTNQSQPVFETHIPNFSSDLYGKKIFVEFLDFIREEKKFSSLEELRQQISRDVNLVK
jgi:riboflavin kinase/FMN adenylyltransferase